MSAYDAWLRECALRWIKCVAHYPVQAEAASEANRASANLTFQERGVLQPPCIYAGDYSGQLQRAVICRFVARNNR